jgi:hypothetical protein
MDNQSQSQQPQQPQQPALNPRVIEEACRYGCKLLASETIATPNAWNGQLASLEQLLVGVLNGRYVLNIAQPAPRDDIAT